MESTFDCTLEGPGGHSLTGDLERWTRSHARGVEEIVWTVVLFLSEPGDVKTFLRVSLPRACNIHSLGLGYQVKDREKQVSSLFLISWRYLSQTLLCCRPPPEYQQHYGRTPEGLFHTVIIRSTFYRLLVLCDDTSECMVHV